VIDAPQEPARFEQAARAALEVAEVGGELHLAIAFVAPGEIQALNAEHRAIDKPTDVLSFPVDEDAPATGPRELGDVVVCAEYTENLVETVVHGVLHLCGYDHEMDDGEMLELQDRVMDGLR